ncbi:Magnesium transporter NIPA2 [Morella rubra]|uniref:Probable magnesium transporter n=1 Tax=Morella rubra TaxID=262757 RepID=A0A6A1VL09_9ROSI|nr:Magnesium transporter NIPA2 [Morella rubra]KAB1213630.1 Magnesium transporter NIPA2 [Morella rubra]
MGFSSDNLHGLILAVSSSIFIGSSFIIKKKGLKKAGNRGTRAGSGGYSYLYEPWWWAGMVTMIVGEIANFAAYAYAPAILVTPLGALSIIFSAVLAHFILEEKLHIFGVLGCVLCVVGSVTIVLHAPQERSIQSVKEVWQLATEPGFIVYTCVVVLVVAVLIFRYVPRCGQTHMVVYIGICSLMGSLTVMSVKAVGIALKLSFSGSNQFIYFQTWFFTVVVIACCLLQINYLNMALDTFNTAVVSPVYYVMFTTFTILASMIMFKDWDSQDASQIATEVCGFITILAGTFLLHKTKDMGNVTPVQPPVIISESRDCSDSNYR